MLHLNHSDFMTKLRDALHAAYLHHPDEQINLNAILGNLDPKHYILFMHVYQNIKTIFLTQRIDLKTAFKQAVKQALWKNKFDVYAPIIAITCLFIPSLLLLLLFDPIFIIPTVCFGVTLWHLKHAENYLSYQEKQNFLQSLLDMTELPDNSINQPIYFCSTTSQPIYLLYLQPTISPASTQPTAPTEPNHYNMPTTQHVEVPPPQQTNRAYFI